MKKTFTSATLLAVLGIYAHSASAADGRITLSGSIDSVTCSVRGGTGTSGAAGDFTVVMKSAPQSKLTTQGDMAGETPFTVTVGGAGESGCTNGKVARLTFNSGASPVDGMTKRLRNADGTARNVHVGITDGAGQLIDLTNNANVPSAAITGNTAVLNFMAHYYAHFTGLVTAGTVETHVMYQIDYN